MNLTPPDTHRHTVKPLPPLHCMFMLFDRRRQGDTNSRVMQLALHLLTDECAVIVAGALGEKKMQ